jgi:parallel beta-helix repeat protein
MRFGYDPRRGARKARISRYAHLVHHTLRKMRRPRSPALTATCLILALVGVLTLSAKALKPTEPTVESTSAAWLGAWVMGDSRGLASSRTATLQLETTIGRKLAIGHSRVPWRQNLGGLAAWHAVEGRIPLISFGRGADTRQVATGVHDAYLTSLARSIRGLGRPVLLRYAWQMDDAASRSWVLSGRDYVAGWRHVRDLFTALGVRASWVWAPNADAFAGARGGVDQYYPGDDQVDWIAADGYNWNTCDGHSGWQPLEAIFKAFYAWGTAHNRQLMISETGTVEDPADPSRKAAWYLDAARSLSQSMRRIRAVVYFDDRRPCNWRHNTSVQAVQGFIRFARDPLFGPASGTPTPSLSSTAAPPTTAAPITSTISLKTTTSTQSTAAVARAPSAISCGGGVSIGTGDNAQSVVTAHGAGTAYIVKAGTHYRNFSVRPKSGDSFCGEPGAVVDGGRSLQFAFYGGGTNVTLDSITVQNYNTGRQNGAIQPDLHATGWVVRNISAVRNYWAGLKAADGMRILGGQYNDNDQLGIASTSATNLTLDGLDGDPATFDGPEMARNRTLHASCGFEAGGMKWINGRVTIRNAHVHHNVCKGLWADGNANGTLIENNLVEDNWSAGILYEISQNAIVRNNSVYRNGNGEADGWYWDGGITVASSFGVEVYGNHLSGNYNGITGTQQDRFDATPPAGLLDDYSVHDNVICAVGAGGHATGVVADNGAYLATRNITFSNNTITSTSC